jgi:actin-related protein
MGSSPVVLDVGSFMCKAGLAGDDAPRELNQSVVGHLKHPGAACMISATGQPQRTAYVGAEAYSKFGILSLTWPVDHGVTPATRKQGPLPLPLPRQRVKVRALIEPSPVQVVVEWNAFEQLVDHTLTSLQACRHAPLRHDTVS